MKEIAALFQKAQVEYNASRPHIDVCLQLIAKCVQRLDANATYSHYHIHRSENVETRYSVFSVGDEVSRPVAEGLMAADPAAHKDLETAALEALGRGTVLSAEEVRLVTRYVYTGVTAFACTYDLWKRGSRKSPGTFFEVFMAALMRKHFPNYGLSKHINLGAMLGDDTTKEEEAARALTGTDEEEEESSVSTDLVVSSPKASVSAVLPLKITTRERVVQPFAHQRILESSFPGRYKSFLCCLSETQLDRKTQTVKQICVPGTMNCPPFRPDTRHKQEGSRISLRIGLCRRTISGSS